MLFFIAKEEIAMASSEQEKERTRKAGEERGPNVTIPKMTEDTGQIFRALHR